ncbi:MAG: hypothetical protein ACREOB_10820, partial [Thermodesulfobacteriota bacterium]
YRKNKLNRVLRHSAFWTSVCGNGFVKQWWDDDKQDEINDMMGDVSFKAETPFHLFFPDLREEDIEEQPYMFHAQIKTPEWVKSTFNEEIRNEANSPNLVDEQLLNILGVNQLNNREQVLVLEIWMKPNVHPLLPDGGMYTCVGHKIAQGFEGWPYSHKQYPFSKIDNIQTGKFYTESVITDLIPLQRELNRTRGQIIEAKNRMAKPQLAAEMGSVDPTKITTEPGQVILYQPGYNQPVPIPLQNLPNYVLEEVNRLLIDMADISGQHEVSQGSVPPGVTAATAISYLQEQDESMLATTYASFEEAVEKTAHQTLTYVKDYWTVPRLVKIVGVDGSFDAQVFKGAQLQDNTDIKIEAGSALPTSRAAKQAFIMDLMKMGFIPPQEGLEVMEIGGLNKIYERLQVDVRQAQRENLKMSSVTEEIIQMNAQQYEGQIDEQTGIPMSPPLVVPVNTWDNHQVHVEIHNRYRKSQSFELVSQEVKRLFEEHVKEHAEALIIGMQTQVPSDLMSPLGQEGEGVPSEGAPQQEGAAPGPAPIPEGEMI